MSAPQAPLPAPAPAPSPAAAVLRRRLAVAGGLVCLGLLVEAATLGWTRPATMLLFLGVGAPLVAVGVLLYLHAIASFGHAAHPPPAMAAGPSPGPDAAAPAAPTDPPVAPGEREGERRA